MPVETKEFIWLTNDLVFKYVFSHEEILMDFLNSYLDFVGSDLRVLNAHITPQKYVQNDHIKLHDCYLDICVVLSNREIINIEMYNNFGMPECKKSLTYASMLYSHQLKKKEPYENAKKVTSLNIMRGNFNEENNNKYSLLDINIETGRRNQIRVQLANIGHPIIGDKKYGKVKYKRMMLEAYYLKFVHPVTKKVCYAELPLNNDFEKLF